VYDDRLGTFVTVPEPCTVIVNVYPEVIVKFAVTTLFPFIVIEVGFVDPVRLPAQWLNTHPVDGFAVS
jgi:hypothetical protein